MDLEVTCDYCEGKRILFRASSGDLDEYQFRAAWKATTTQGPNGEPRFRNILCRTCGADYRVIDDGKSLTEGGFVTQQDASRPIINRIAANTGPRTGGNAIYIQGIGLDIGETLTVRFGPRACEVVDNRSKTAARVIVPQGCYKLNLVGYPTTKLRLSSVTGEFRLNESFTTTEIATGTICYIEGDYHWVTFSDRPASIDLPGQIITGGTAGAYGTIQSAETLELQAGENVYGITSGAKATYRGDGWVDYPTKGFAPGELVFGLTSRTYAKIGPAPAYSGTVDVTVENDYGRRPEGSALIGGYTYL